MYSTFDLIHSILPTVSAVSQILSRITTTVIATVDVIRLMDNNNGQICGRDHAVAVDIQELIKRGDNHAVVVVESV